jgi:hypothetical protein
MVDRHDPARTGVKAGRVVGLLTALLVGVVYDWLDHPPVSVLIGIVLVVGVVDGVGAVLETRTTAIGVAYVLAWLCYVPVFVWLLDEEQTEQQGPLRLDDV